MPRQTYPGIDARLVSIVRIKCNQLIGRYGIRAEDLEDFRQEWIAAAIRTPEYQNRQHPKFSTFIGRIIDRLIISEIRRRKAEQRDYRAIAYSLDDYLDKSDEDEARHETISEEDYFERTGASFLEHRDAVTIRQDVEAFIRSLPEDLRELALHLKHHRMQEVSKVAGISRATAFRRLQILRQAADTFFSQDGETVFRGAAQRPVTGPSGD